MANGKNGSYDVIKIIVSLIVILSAVAGTILWAVNSHSEIRDWTAEQDYITKTECKEIIKDGYVRKEDFATVRQQIKTLEEELKYIKRRVHNRGSSGSSPPSRVHALVPNEYGDGR